MMMMMMMMMILTSWKVKNIQYNLKIIIIYKNAK